MYLRFRYACPRDPAADVGVPCLWPGASRRYPTADGGVTSAPPRGMRGAALACSGGVGSAMTLTATRGPAAAALVLARLARSST